MPNGGVRDICPNETLANTHPSDHVRRDTIGSAIRNGELLEFDYDGMHRVVAPYYHGLTSSKQEALCAVQLRENGLDGFGKLWSVHKIQNLRRTARFFVRDDSQYPASDSALTPIRDSEDCAKDLAVPKEPTHLVTPPDTRLVTELALFDRRLIRLLHRGEVDLRQLHHRQFEELIAVLWDSFGYDVELTKRHATAGRTSSQSAGATRR